jgi:hypothetical protein
VHGERLFAFADSRVQRNRRIPPPSSPPAPSITRLIDRDAIQPRFQIGVAAELLYRLKRAKKSLLGQVARFLSVAGQPEEQGIYVSRSFRNQLFEGGRIVPLQSFKELIFGPLKKRIFRSRTLTD